MSHAAEDAPRCMSWYGLEEYVTAVWPGDHRRDEAYQREAALAVDNIIARQSMMDDFSIARPGRICAMRECGSRVWTAASARVRKYSQSAPCLGRRYGSTQIFIRSREFAISPKQAIEVAKLRFDEINAPFHLVVRSDMFYRRFSWWTEMTRCLVW